MLLRVAGAAGAIGARALLIHCESEEARSFYLHIAEFEPSPTDPLHLFLLMRENCAGTQWSSAYAASHSELAAPTA